MWQNVFNFAFYERGRYTLIPRTNFCDNFIIFVILLRIRVFSGRCNKRYKYQIIECYACVTLYYTPDFFHRAKNENGCYQFKSNLCVHKCEQTMGKPSACDRYYFKSPIT